MCFRPDNKKPKFVRGWAIGNAPGTGKSFSTDQETKGKATFRTTFHPDRNSPHFGSVELLDALRARRPRYALCGHIHTGDHNPIVLNHDDGSKTIVRNVSRLDEDYEVRFEPFVFDL